MEISEPEKTMFGTPVKKLLMGETSISFDEVMELANSLRPIYTAESYHVFDNNCNNFSNEFLQLIIDKGIPEEILN